MIIKDMPFKNTFFFLLLIFSILSFSENLVMFPESYNFIKEKAYSKKDKEYLFEMGKIHYYGVKHQGTGELFIKPNMAKSLEDFKESYDLGYKKETAPFIAHMYFYGTDDIKQDKKKGLKYYEDVLKYGSSKDKDEAISIINENQDEINRIQPDFFRTTEGLPKEQDSFNPTTTPRPPTPPFDSIITTPIPERVPQSVPPKNLFSPPPSHITKEQFIEFKNTFEPYLDIQIAKAKKFKASLAGVPPNNTTIANLQLWLSRVETIKRQLNVPNRLEEYNRLKEELLNLLKTSPFASILRGVQVNSSIGSGNGFLYSSKYVITNYHVISDKSVKKQAQTGQIMNIELINNNKRNVKLIYYDCDNDLALLEVQGNPITNEDLLEPSERTYLQQLAKSGLVTKKDINTMLQSQLDKTIPLTSNAQKGSVVEYLKSDLSVIESGKVIFLNNHYGILKNTNIVKGYSGGGIFYQNELACITQGGITIQNYRRILCISSSQIESFINKRNQQPEKFCKCKNFLLIFKAIEDYANSKPLSYVVSARDFLLQASKESIKLMIKAFSGKRISKTVERRIEYTIKVLNRKAKKKDPNHQEPAANVCRDF